MEHFMINGGEVLRFIDEDKGKSRVCSSEQCGHVYLIVIVNRPGVGGFDGREEDLFQEVLGEGGGGFVESGVKVSRGDKSLSVRELSFGNVAQALSEADGPDDFPELVIGFPLLAFWQAADGLAKEVLAFLWV
jgi:hypothetical protein